MAPAGRHWHPLCGRASGSRTLQFPRAASALYRRDGRLFRLIQPLPPVLRLNVDVRAHPVDAVNDGDSEHAPGQKISPSLRIHPGVPMALRGQGIVTIGRPHQAHRLRGLAVITALSFTDLVGVRSMFGVSDSRENEQWEVGHLPKVVRLRDGVQLWVGFDFLEGIERRFRRLDDEASGSDNSDTLVVERVLEGNHEREGRKLAEWVESIDRSLRSPIVALALECL